MPWLGGKQALVPRLLPLIPEHVSYVEVFGGAAALLLNKPPSQIEVYNDLDSELVNLFEVIRNDADAFLERASFLLYSRELYRRWTDDLEQGTTPEDPVERAVRFWYVIRSAFGAHPGKNILDAPCDADALRLLIVKKLQDLQTIMQRDASVHSHSLESDPHSVVETVNVEAAFHADVHVRVSVFKKEGLRTVSLEPRAISCEASKPASENSLTESG